MIFTKKKVMSSLIAAAILFSSLPTLVWADNDVDETVPTTAETTIETTAETTAETTVEETKDANVTTIPSDEKTPTEETTEDIEEPPIEETTTESSETEKTSETSETTVTETTQETTKTTETTVETTEPSETTETTVETSETSETTAETTATETSKIIIAKSYDEYFELIAKLPDAERIIVDTTKDLSMLNVKAGVYFDGTYILAFENSAEKAVTVNTLVSLGISYSLDGELTTCDNEEDEEYGDYIGHPDDSYDPNFDYDSLPEEEYDDDSNDGIFVDKQINPNAKVKVAIIDTGSNKANESYSVIGDSTSDDNGHGTMMANAVLDGSDNAYIISIKALDKDGHGQMSDVYAAIQLAESMKVDYILLAMSIRDNGKYEAFKELIKSTKATIVASAGNNGTDAKKYLPASIDKVYTIGAVDEDSILRSFSNYGTCVNYYVVADSTSEAAAYATGIILSKSSEEIFYYLSPYAIGNDNMLYTDSNVEYFEADATVKGTKYKEVFTLPAGKSLSSFRRKVLDKAKSYSDKGTSFSSGCIHMVKSCYNNNSYYNAPDTGFKFDTPGAGCTTSMKSLGYPNPNNVGITGLTSKDPKGSAKALFNYVVSYADPGDIIMFGNPKASSDYPWRHAAIYAGAWKPGKKGSGKGSIAEGIVHFVGGKNKTGSKDYMYGGVYVPTLVLYECPGNGKSAQRRLLNAQDMTVTDKKSFTTAFIIKAKAPAANNSFTIDKSVEEDYKDVVTNNPCYSYEGTVYELYSKTKVDAAIAESGITDIKEAIAYMKEQDVGDPDDETNANAKYEPDFTFSIGEDGTCEDVFQITTTNAGTYYLVESSAGAGLSVDEEVHTVIMSTTAVTLDGHNLGKNAAGHFLGHVTDTPLTDPVSIQLRKVDSFGKPVNGATMNGATFILEYYGTDLGNPKDEDTSGNEGDDDDYQDENGEGLDEPIENPVDEAIQPLVVYRITINGTNARDIFLSDLQALTPIGGTNPNYLKNLGNSTSGEFPLGTIRLYEETAPSGYTKNEQVIRIRMYQDPEDPDHSIEEYLVETETGSSRYWNHTLNGDDMSLVLAEAPEIGYYELTKSIPVNGYNLSGFEFELWNKTENIQIATGVSQANGKVLWTYVVEGYKSNADPTVTLTGTTTEKLELALGPSNNRIEYEVREKIKTNAVNEAGIPISFKTPTVEGKTVTAGTGYYSISETFTENGATVSRIFTNPVEHVNLSIRKSDISNDDTAKTFTFDVFWLGNGETANESASKKAGTISVTTNTAGEGTGTLEGLPLGWYKVVETDTNGLKVTYPDGQIVDGRTDGAKLTFDVINSDIPKIGTTLIDGTTNDHVGIISENITLTDTVSYSGLFAGTYTVKGTLMNKATNQPLKINGNTVTAEATFTLNAQTNAYGKEIQQKGTVDVTFTFNSTDLKNVSVVAFEELYLGNELIVEHKDINEEGQTVHFPEINTVLVQTDKKDVLEYKPGETVSLTDTVYYRNLVPNKQYTIKGVLVSKTENGVETAYTGTKTFTATTSEGIETVTFSVPYNDITGKILVAYEGLSFNGVTILEDNDINNEAETVYVPDIKTTLKDNATGDQISSSVENITLTDTVKYTSLKPGVKYLMTGTLVNKETGEAIKDSNGNPIYGSTEFTPETPDGTVDVVFTFKNVVLPNTTIVAFERLEYEGIDVAIHADIDDYPQTTFIPDIHTTFYDVAFGEKAVGDGASLASYGKTVKLVDKVYYENVVPGKEYSVTGTVMVKSTKEALKDAEGKPYTVTKTFTPTDKSGYVEVEFEIDTTVIPNTSLVCYETLSFNSVKLVIHNNIDDIDQTVNVPGVQTTATDKADGDKAVDGTKTSQTIVDTVKYTNLIVNKEYTITGKLVVKKDYADGEEPEVVKGLDGNDLIVSKTFTAEKADGTETLEFTFDASKYSGYQVVVFEDLYFNDIKIGTHSDLTDDNQTVEISLLLHVKIIKFDGQERYALKGAKIAIKKALIGPDGELVKDKDGNIKYEDVKDINGNDCVALSDSDGFVDFTIVWDRHYKYFAKEIEAPKDYKLSDKYYEVVPTEKRESEGICRIDIDMPNFFIPPKTGDSMNIPLMITLAALSVLGIAGVAVYVTKSKKGKKNSEESSEQ